LRLAIISHTEHYKNSEGTIVGWGPTISEINFLAQRFDTIYHIAFLHEKDPPPSSLPYTSSKIIFVPISPSGGVSVIAKLSVLWAMPSTIQIVRKILRKVDAFQLRTPTGIGVYLIPWLTFFVKKKGWYKYAGNWSQKNAPLGYAIQRALLKRQSRKVTINGAWPKQKKHCLTFENPCLLKEERIEGTKFIEQKQYDNKLTFCFVGRLEDDKGVQRIIDAFGALLNLKNIDKIHFIGNGSKLKDYKKQVSKLKLPIVFHGFLEREKVFDIYKRSQFLLLPSTASEGFPKVIAEAMNFGCIPIVSIVSSIGQYITFDNGYLVSPATSEQLLKVLKQILIESSDVLKQKAKKGHYIAESFTFQNYSNRICNEILEL